MFYSFVCREQGPYTTDLAKSSTYSPLRRKGRNNLVLRLLERLLGGCYTRGDKHLGLLRDPCRSRNGYSVGLWSVRKRDCAWAAASTLT